MLKGSVSQSQNGELNIGKVVSLLQLPEPLPEVLAVSRRSSVSVGG